MGLLLNSVENASVDGNVIGGNNIGLQLTGSGPDVEQNVFYGNQIGDGGLGTIALPNTSYGVSLTSAIGNFFGPTTSGGGNVIAFNGGVGIHVSGGQQNQFTQNSIFANAGAGIKLVSGGEPVRHSARDDLHSGNGEHRHSLGDTHLKSEPGLRGRDLLEPVGPGGRAGTGQDFRQGCDGEHRRLG